MLKVPRRWSLFFTVLGAFILFFIGILILHPLYVSVGDCTNTSAQHKCEEQNLLYYIFLKFFEVITHAEFWTALATVAIATYTRTLYWATKGLKESTDRLWDAARSEFLSTHRPKIRLKHIWIASQDGLSFSGKLKADVPLTVRLDFVNIGETDAIISLINFITVILDHDAKLPQRPPYNQPGVRQFPVGAFRLGSGITFTIPVSDNHVLSKAEVGAVELGASNLFFIGTIEYWDDAKNVRQTAFCRRMVFTHVFGHSSSEGRFIKVKDPDYEYQD